MNAPASKRKAGKPALFGCLGVIVVFGSLIGGCLFDSFPVLQKLAQPIMCTGDEKLEYTGKAQRTYRNTKYMEYTVLCVTSDGAAREISRAAVIVIQLVAMWTVLFIIGALMWVLRRRQRTS